MLCLKSKKNHTLIIINCRNSETCSGNKTNLAKLDVFHHKSISRILKIRMNEVDEERTSNRKLRRRFGDIKTLSETWWCRLLKLIGRTTRQDEHTLPKIFLSVHVEGSMLQVKPFRKNKDAIVESLRMLMPSMPESSDCKHWIGHADNEVEWK